MEIIDAQLHIWEKEHPGRPYAASYNRTPRPGHRRGWTILEGYKL